MLDITLHTLALWITGGLQGCSIAATNAGCLGRVYILLPYGIVTNYNGPLATAQARIHVATHIEVANYGAILALK